MTTNVIKWIKTANDVRKSKGCERSKNVDDRKKKPAGRNAKSNGGRKCLFLEHCCPVSSRKAEDAVEALLAHSTLEVSARRDRDDV